MASEEDFWGLNVKVVDGIRKDTFILADATGLKSYRFKGDEVQRISGTEIAGNPVERIREMVNEFDGMDVSAHILREMETFEEMMIALYVIKYKIMKQKQADYGPKSIRLGDELDIIGLINKKMERAKNLLGDPKQQLTAVKDIVEGVPDDANASELEQAFFELENILFPKHSVRDESIEDTAVDAANYGDILFLLIMKVWGKPLR